MNLKKLIKQWKHRHPDTRSWSDEEIIEAALLRLCVTNPERVKMTGRKDGKPIFEITPP